MWHVLIVDEQTSQGQEIREVLEQDEEIKISHGIVNSENNLQIRQVYDKVDLVIINMKMPMMYGMETMGVIRQRYPHSKLFVRPVYKEKVNKALHPESEYGFMQHTIGKEICEIIYQVIGKPLRNENEKASKTTPYLLDERLIMNKSIV